MYKKFTSKRDKQGENVFNRSGKGSDWCKRILQGTDWNALDLARREVLFE